MSIFLISIVLSMIMFTYKCEYAWCRWCMLLLNMTLMKKINILEYAFGEGGGGHQKAYALYAFINVDNCERPLRQNSCLFTSTRITIIPNSGGGLRWFGVIQVLRNARGGGWVYAQAL